MFILINDVLLTYVSKLVSDFKMRPTTRIVIFICAIFNFGLAASDTPKGAYIQKLNPLNPYDIKGDDIDKGGEVSKGESKF